MQRKCHEKMKFIGALYGWLLLLGLVVLGIAFVCVSCGVHLKRKETMGNKLAAPITKLPQPSEDQRRLEEIERNLDYAVGTIMANPMTPGKGACEAEIAALEQEKSGRIP